MKNLLVKLLVLIGVEVLMLAILIHKERTEPWNSSEILDLNEHRDIHLYKYKNKRHGCL